MIIDIILNGGNMHSRDDAYRNHKLRVSSLVMFSAGLLAYAGYIAHDPDFLFLALLFDLGALAFMGKEFVKVVRKIFF